MTQSGGQGLTVIASSLCQSANQELKPSPRSNRHDIRTVAILGQAPILRLPGVQAHAEARPKHREFPRLLSKVKTMLSFRKGRSDLVFGWF